MIQIDPKKLSVISDTPIEKLALDNKVYLRLKDSGVNNVGDILRKSNYELLSIVRADQAAMDNIKKGIVNLVQNTNIAAVVPNKIEIKAGRAHSISSEKDDTLSGNKGEFRQEAINYGTDPIRDHSKDTSNADPLDTSILDLDISSKAYYALMFSNLNTVRDIISIEKSALSRKHKRLDNSKLEEVSDAIKSFAMEKGIEDKYLKYPFFSESKASLMPEPSWQNQNVKVETDTETEAENTRIIDTREWTDNELESEFGELYFCIQKLLKEQYDAGSPIWISLVELQTKLEERFPDLTEDIWDQNKTKTILDNAAWASSVSTFYCWKPSEYSKSEMDKSAIIISETEENDEGSSVKENSFDNVHASLDDCIKEILVSRKNSGSEWTTAMTVYDVLREKYPSIAEETQLVDVREALTTSEWIEKDEFYYRIRENAYANPISALNQGVEPQTEDGEAVDCLPTENTGTCELNEAYLRDGSRNLQTEEDTKETLVGVATQKQQDAIKKIPIEELKLSVRSRNCLWREGVMTIGDLTEIKPDELLKMRNLGQRSYAEILEKLEEFLQQLCETEFLEGEIYSKGLLQKNKDKSDELEKKIIGGRVVIDMPIEDMGLSVRSYNALKRADISFLSQIVTKTREDLMSIRNMGVGSVNEVIDKVKSLSDNDAIIDNPNDEAAQVEIRNYYESEEYAKKIREKVKIIIQRQGFDGLTAAEIISQIKSDEPEEAIAKCTEKALKLLLGDQDIFEESNKYHYNYPSIYSAIKALSDEHQFYIRERLEGKTLEEIATSVGKTREWVRQAISRDLKALRRGSKHLDPIYNLKEDEYRYIYENYYISKDEWLEVIGEKEYIYYYLQTVYKRGGRPLILSIDDDRIDVEIKRRIQAKDDEKYIIVGNRRIKKSRNEIEDYVIYRDFKDEGTIEEFYDAYKSFLEEHRIDDTDLRLTDEQRRTRENKIAASRKVLWKQNRRLRYYDIDGTDFQELLDTLDLDQYENIELSTLKFILDYPELMEEYDIRDEYELHNLLKKICYPDDYHNLVFGRMPGITFGHFSRDDAVKEMLFNLAPISQDELAEAISQKYGFRIASIKANWLDSIDEYYSNGEYHTEDEDEMPLTEEQLCELSDVLTGDFYFINDVAREYSRILGEKRSPGAYILKRMGYKVHSDYIFKGANTAAEYFLNLLTKTDIVDVSQYGPKLYAIAAFNQVNYSLREEYVILEFEPYKYVNISRLNSFGIEKKDIVSYCNAVKKFVGESNYFTIPWLRKQGFTSKLDDLGFDDFFYETILALDPEVTSFINRSDNRKGSALLKVGDERGSKSDFIVKIIEREGSVDRDDLINYCAREYNIILRDNDIYHGLEDSDVYYDSIMGKYYANYSLYYEEV